jgi:hypothetical protein
LQKYFCFPLTQISSLIRAVLSQQRGVAHVINVGRDAVDAAALGVCVMAGQADKACEQSNGVLDERC